MSNHRCEFCENDVYALLHGRLLKSKEKGNYD